MGQVSRISLSATLITALGCGTLPVQVQRSGVHEAASTPMTLFWFAPPPPTGWLLDDEHNEEELASNETEEEQEEESESLAPQPEHIPDASTDTFAPRLLKLYSKHEETFLEVAIDNQGRIADGDRSRLEYFFRCRRTERTHEMSQGVLKILYAISEKYRGRVIEIISGYRTYPYGVRDSKHYEGHAIDLRVRGVKTAKVRDFVWSHFSDVGVGHYEHQNFVHVDFRPEEKDAAWTSVAPNDDYAYNPNWALRLRAPWRAPRALQPRL